MSGISNHAALFGESLERVTRDEPSCPDVVLVEEAEHSSHSNCAGEHALILSAQDYCVPLHIRTHREKCHWSSPRLHRNPA